MDLNTILLVVVVVVVVIVVVVLAVPLCKMCFRWYTKRRRTTREPPAEETNCNVTGPTSVQTRHHPDSSVHFSMSDPTYTETPRPVHPRVNGWDVPSPNRPDSIVSNDSSGLPDYGFERPRLPPGGVVRLGGEYYIARY